MTINLSNWLYFAFIIVLLVLAGTGEYLHIIPSGTFGSLLLVAIGLIAPSPIVHATTTTTVVPAASNESSHAG